jgi:hypothetical protein
MWDDQVDLVERWLWSADEAPDDIRARAAEVWDETGDYYPVRKFPESRPCHGRDEIVDFVVQFRDAWSNLAWEIRDIVDVGSDRMLVCSAIRAEGHGSGMTLEGDVYQSIWLRNGRFLRVEDHLTLSGALHAFGVEAETLEAAGLRG